MNPNKPLTLRRCKPVICFLFLCCAAALFSAPAFAQTPLARNGQALLPVVTRAGASEATKQHAATLAEYLGRISGAKFVVQAGDGAAGIAVGTVGDFPALAVAAEVGAGPVEARENYLLRSHDKGVYVIGATELAVRHAVWDLLYRLGHRQFFPGAHWEVVPSTPELTINVNAKEQPDYLARRIWYGHGDWRENQADKNNWDARNRMAAGINLSTGHAWDNIYARNKAEFDKHPEYLMSAKPVKFCVSNPGLRKLVVDYALAHFEKNPDADSISLDPSDGGGWENANGSCPDGTVYKSVSDRVVTLANEVAAAVNEKYPGKYVGIYAYHQHSPAPTIKVHPNVVASVATSFSSGSVADLTSGWSRQGAKIGIREYYNVVVWNKDKPGGPPASNTAAIADTVPRFYKYGARFMSAESSNSWGALGLGHYIAARLLWDTGEDAEAIKNDFFTKAFGPAQAPIREWYRMTDRGNRPLFSRHLIGSMYRQLDAAYKLTNDAAIRARLDDLVLYTRYAEVLFGLESGGEDNLMANTEAALRHAYRARRSHMMHSYALWRDTRSFARPTGDTIWSVPEGKNPWKNSEPFTAQEISDLMQAGIANNPLMDFEPKAFSKDLIPVAGQLQLGNPKPGFYGSVRMNHSFLMWVEAPGEIELQVTPALMDKEPAPAQSTPVTLYALENPVDEPVQTIAVPHNKTANTIKFKTQFSGLHRVELATRRRGAHVNWATGTPVVFTSSIDEPIGLSHRIHMYFYVPKGTKTIGFFANGPGFVLDGDGKRAMTLPEGANGYYSIPVAAGQDGKAWQFTNSAGQRLLMTVPPYLARHPSELLLPREVVEADAK